jgi:hypothetical protein
VAQFRSILGRDLARVLCADGWKPRKSRRDLVILWKGNLRPIGLTLNIVISTKRVKALCKTADIPAWKFEQLFISAPPVDFSAALPLFVTPLAPPQST